MARLLAVEAARAAAVMAVIITMPIPVRLHLQDRLAAASPRADLAPAATSGRAALVEPARPVRAAPTQPTLAKDRLMTGIVIAGMFSNRR